MASRRVLASLLLRSSKPSSASPKPSTINLNLCRHFGSGILTCPEDHPIYRLIYGPALKREERQASSSQPSKGLNGGDTTLSQLKDAKPIEVRGDRINHPKFGSKDQAQRRRGSTTIKITSNNNEPMLPSWDIATPIQARWDKTKESVFIDLMVEKVKARGTTILIGTFSENEWQDIRRKYYEVFKEIYNISAYKSRMYCLKDKYKEHKRLVDENTQLEWDSLLCTVRADSKWWDDYMKSHPKAKWTRKFRVEGCPEFKRMAFIFGDTVASATSSLNSRNDKDVDCPKLTKDVPNATSTLLLNGPHTKDSTNMDEEVEELATHFPLLKPAVGNTRCGRSFPNSTSCNNAPLDQRHIKGSIDIGEEVQEATSSPPSKTTSGRTRLGNSVSHSTSRSYVPHTEDSTNTGEVNGTTSSPPSSKTTSRNTRCGKRDRMLADINESLLMLQETLKASFEENKSWAAEEETNYTISECIKIIEAMQLVLDDRTYIRAMQLLQEKGWRETFFHMPEHRRRAWFKSIEHGSI